MIANKVNTYYTRAKWRYMSAPRARGAEKNLRMWEKMRAAERALAQVEGMPKPRGMGYYPNEPGHKEWLRAAGYLA